MPMCRKKGTTNVQATEPRSKNANNNNKNKPKNENEQAAEQINKLIIKTNQTNIENIKRDQVVVPLE